MKCALFPIAMSFMLERGDPSVSLSSPLISESKFFPDEERLLSPEPAKLLSSESYISQSNDTSPGPHRPTITILASDLATEKYLIERQECNLLIIQNRKNHKSFDFKQNKAAGAVTSYFTAVDRAFAYCLEFLKLMNDPDEWNKDWYLMPFMRSLNNAIDRMTQRAEIVKLFQSKELEDQRRRNQHENAWKFIKHVGCGLHPAQPVGTSIPAEISRKVRRTVFDICGGALKILFREKMNEFFALINHPMLAFLGGTLPSKMTETLRRMEKFIQMALPLVRNPHLMLESLIHDCLYLTKFKGDLDALRKVYDWKQENNEGHVVVNLSHRCDQKDDAFDFMRIALLRMGWDENAVFYWIVMKV